MPRCKKRVCFLGRVIILLVFVIAPVYSFRPALHNIYRANQPRIRNTSSANSSSDIDASIKELKSLIPTKNGDKNIQISASNNNGAEKKMISNEKKQMKSKPTLISIKQKPVGNLTSADMNSLCNSIRHHRKGASFNNLQTLERILLELEHIQKNNLVATNKRPYLKHIHIFPLLAALSKDIRIWKQKEGRKKRSRFVSNLQKSKSVSQKIGKKEIQRLVKVVTLLNHLQDNNNLLQTGCYTKDIPSFAAMITAEASRWDSSAVDAALLFLDMVEKEEGEAEQWDPRLIGAILDALARVGRAEEAQNLLGRAMGVEISRFDLKPNKENITKSTKRLDPFCAGPCYDALLRAYANRAEYQNARTKAQSPYRNAPKSAISSLEQARHILLNHMPLQPELSITNKTCTAVLNGYSTLGLGSECERVLNEIEALHISPLYSKSSSTSLSSTVGSSLDGIAYNTILNAYSQSQNPNAVERAERIFVAMKEQSPLNISVSKSVSTNTNDKEAPSALSFSVIPPGADFISYSSMLNCYSKHGMVSKAEGLLVEMSEDSPYQPTVACYLPLINGLEKSNDSDVPARVISLIERCERSLRRPNRLLYIAALRCMRRHGRGEEAEVLLEKFHRAFPSLGGPDVYSYVSVLRAYERTIPKENRLDAANNAEVFFNKMQEKVNEAVLPSLDVNVYNILLNCYSRAGQAEKAEKLLAEMELGIRNPNNTSIVKPNNKSYSLVIKALGNSDSSYAVTFGWEVLYRLGFPKDIKQGKKAVPFNVSLANLNAMLKLFAKRGMAREAEDLLNKIDDLKMDGFLKQSPDITSYEAVLEALGRSGGDIDAVTRAEALVTRLEVKSELGLTNLQPSLLAYNTLLNCYGNAGMAGKAESLLERLGNNADSYSYGGTIKAIANSGLCQQVAISKADSLANKLGDKNNEVIYAHRLKLASKFGLGGESENLIKQMNKRNMKPSVIHYTAALNAWAKSNDKDALNRAELLFKAMEEKFDLDLASYNAMLFNYSSKGKAKKARLLLQHIIDTPELNPSKVTFTAVIDAYYRSKSNNRGTKAEELLDQMRELHAGGNNDVEPDQVTYASVIRCITEINDIESLEQLKLMRKLQIESWPFEDELNLLKP